MEVFVGRPTLLYPCIEVYGQRHSKVSLYFTSSVQQVFCFTCMACEKTASGRKTAIEQGTASKIYVNSSSILLMFTPYFFFKRFVGYKWCIYTVVLTRLHHRLITGIYKYIYFNRYIGIRVRVFHPRLNHTKDLKMVLDTSLLNPQYYKVWIKSKWSYLGKEELPPQQVAAIENRPFGLHSTMVGQHIYIYIYIYIIDPVSIVFGNDLGDWGSIPGLAIPNTQKMALNSALLDTQYYKVRIKGKVKQSRELSCALPYTLV